MNNFKTVKVNLEVNMSDLSHLEEWEERVEYIENMIYAGIENYGADVRVGSVDIE